MKNISIFADTADLISVHEMAELTVVEGFTTNPTLMKQAGISNYSLFADKMLGYLSEYKTGAPVSFEVFADEPIVMLEQAKIINGWGKAHGHPVYVKVPIMNTRGEVMTWLIEKMLEESISPNVTAVLNQKQYIQAVKALQSSVPSIISVFAGRIADTGYNAKDIVSSCLRYNNNPNTETLWASAREVYNVVEADSVGCDIITLTPALIKKLPNMGRHLREVSLDTVKMFFNDAKASGYII